MESKELNPNTPVEEDTFDIMEMIHNLWVSRKTFLKIALAFLLLGIVVALFSPKKYTVTTLMVPQVAQKQTSGGISSLASMVGVNLGSLNSGDMTLSPMLYPKILSSATFQKELMYTPLFFEKYDRNITLMEYYTEVKKPSIIGLIKKYTIGLPGVIITAFKSKDTVDDDLSIALDGIIRLTLEEEIVSKSIRQVISLTTDPKEGYVTIGAVFEDRLATAHLVRETQKLLQEYITSYKLEKISSDLEFVEARYEAAKETYEAIQKEYALYLDSNVGLTTAHARTKTEQLRNEVQLQYSIYSELAVQLEKTKIAVKETTPVLTIIDPVSIPVEKSHPQRLKIIFIYVFLGVILAAVIVLSAPYLKKQLDIIRNKEDDLLLEERSEE